MRLFLCTLLAYKPVVAQAIVTGLNGARFFDLYVPELGLELRIQCEEIQPAPVLTDWNKNARCALTSVHMIPLKWCHPAGGCLYWSIGTPCGSVPMNCAQLSIQPSCSNLQS
jgi:hypothetical protein